MSMLQRTITSGAVTSYPSQWYFQDTNWRAKAVTGAADRYTIESPDAVQVDVGGTSLTQYSKQTLDLSLDTNWDVGQNIGVWAAGHEYSIGDKVRANIGALKTPIWSGAISCSGSTPSARRGHSSVIYGNYMYMYGGTNNGTELRQLDLTTNNWSVAIPCSGTPPSQGGGTAFIYNGYMYIFGGLSDNAIHRLNLTTFAWSGALSTSGTPPVSRDSCSSVVYGEYAYIFGGYTSTSTYVVDVHRINLTTLAWSGALSVSGTPPTAGGWDHTGALYDGKLSGSVAYFCGGIGSGDTIEVNSFNLETLTWSNPISTTGTAPTKPYKIGVYVIDGYLYAINGCNSGGYNTTISRLNLTTNVWEGPLAVSGTPYSVFGFPQSVLYNGYVFAFGGWNGGDLNQTHKLNLNNPVSYVCTTTGTSHATTEPTWGLSVGGTTAESGSTLVWTAYLDNTIASNRVGQDFYVYSVSRSEGSVPKFLLSANSTMPTGYSANTSRKIAGFHCLCLSAGTISGHDLTGYVTGDIIPTSIWDLNRKSLASNGNVGQAYNDETGEWAGLYPVSGTKTAPTIVYGGTILVSTDWNDAVSAAKVLNMKLPNDSVFQSIAAGSNEQTVITGAALPTTVTGAVDSAGVRMISNIGCEMCCGALDYWLDEQSYRFDGAAAHTHTVTMTDGKRVATISLGTSGGTGYTEGDVLTIAQAGSRKAATATANVTDGVVTGVTLTSTVGSGYTAANDVATRTINSTNPQVLLHMDGADNSTTFTDDGTGNHLITRYGDAKISTAQSQFGGASAYFDGSGDYLKVANSEAFNFGSGNFTIDFWMYPTAVGGSQRTVIDNNTSIVVATGSDSKLKYYLGTTAPWNLLLGGTGTTTITANSWYHIAMVRNGSAWSFYVNGSLDYSMTSASSLATPTTYPLYIMSSGGSYINIGYIDEFRITKGSALWTSAFSVPTGAASLTGGAGCQINVLTTATDTARTSAVASADVAPAWGWYDLPGSFGQIYRQGSYGDVKLTAGGKATGTAANAGSRGRDASNYRWATSTGIGIRLVANSIEK